VTYTWAPVRDRGRRWRDVPVDLIRYTCGHEDHAEFLRSGAEVATMLNLALLKHTGRPVSGYPRLLDFGCGAGRVTRFLDAASVTGCDVNPQVIDQCRRLLRRGRFDCTGLMPPLPYSDGAFDLVCSFSVFSHLREDVEQVWLRELVRIGAPGCVYLLSVQGDWMIEATLPADEAEAARAAGFTLREVHLRNGSSLDFPDYYESSYHTSSWVRENWSTHFEVLDVIRGDNPVRYLSGGLQFAPAGQIPVLRPLGQDLVVARKRA
jgi:SAM-dependent methyltransferase